MNSHEIGKPAKRIGYKEIITGKAQYCADLTFPNMLAGQLLYSSYPSARIIRLDVEKARSLPGVKAVLTHNDVPGENSYLYMDSDQPLFATDKVYYLGDIVAAVAAESKKAAEAALEAIEVEYEPLSGVHDMMEAIKPGAPQVWSHRENLLEHQSMSIGDMEAGFDQADVIVEDTYFTSRVEHAPIETEGAIALMEHDGTVVVYTSSQVPYGDKMQIARALDLPENMVRVILPRIGGAFGCKIEAHVQIHAALLTQATGLPVKIIRTREESILTHPKRHPFRMEYRTGARKDGKITAVQAKIFADAGPYTNASNVVMTVALTNSWGPYFVPNASLEGSTILTNNPICGAMRGFGAPQVAFGYEQQMDRIAHKLGMDPLEIRMINGLETGTQLPTGVKIREGAGMKECLQEASRMFGWKDRHSNERAPEPHLRRGWGMASGLFGICLGRDVPDSSSVIVEMAKDGAVILRTGVSEMGQGTHTVLAQIAAETIGVPTSMVAIIEPDTDKTLDAGPTVGTRSTVVSGNATIRAASVIRQSLLETAAEETGHSVEKLDLREGLLFVDGEESSIQLSDLVLNAWLKNRRLSAIGYYAPEYPEDLAENEFHGSPYIYTYSTQIAQVLVDTETGKVHLEKIVAVHEAGKIINPDGALGQVEGGCSMGVGYALMEELLVDKGITGNCTFENYLIPSSADIPDTEAVVLEIPEPYSPYGAKGLGEVGVIPTAPAIANAVHDAIGVRMRQIPVTPERVLAAIDTKEKIDKSTS